MDGDTFHDLKRGYEKRIIDIDVVFGKLHDYGTEERVDGRRETSDTSRQRNVRSRVNIMISRQRVRMFANNAGLRCIVRKINSIPVVVGRVLTTR